MTPVWRSPWITPIGCCVPARGWWCWPIALPALRWPTLVQHREVIVLLMTDPLEREPPRVTLPFLVDHLVERIASAGAVPATRRIELDLAGAAQRERWQSAFSGPLDEAVAILARSGIRARALSTDAPSESWLDLFAGTRAA